MLTIEEQIETAIDKAKCLLVCFPPDGNGDAMSAALGLTAYLQILGKETDIITSVSPDKNQRLKRLSILPGYGNIKDELENLRSFIVSLDIKDTQVKQIRYTMENSRLNFIISPAKGWFSPSDIKSRAGNFKYDLIITVGSNDLESLGGIYSQNIEFFYQANIINIDNSPANEGFGQINLIDLNAVSLAEMIFYLINGDQKKTDEIDENVATCLLSGIICATNNFKNTKLTPQALFSASSLISIGARREDITGALFRSKSLNTLKLWGRMLNAINNDAELGIVWTEALEKDFEETGTNVDDLIANIPKIKLAIIFYKDNGENAALIYSLKNINCLDITKAFNPTGSVKMATIKDSLLTADQWKEKVIADISLKLEKLNL
jgi:nanoRNase/pAp phosphatase (c-di-AMP/oligoRNAs hydrolase)